MAEDATLDELKAGISADDIKPNIYEGGFKTWECSIDLANYILSCAPEMSESLTRACTVIEVDQSQ